MCLTPKPLGRTVFPSLGDRPPPPESRALQPRLEGANHGEHFPLLAPRGARGQGSYLVPDPIVTDALGAGLLGDTAAFQQHVVQGAEAAF